MRRGDFRQVHHQHRADREVGRDDPTQAFRFACGLELVDVGCRKAGRAHNRRSADGHCSEHVVHCFRRSREIHEGAGSLRVQEGSQVIPACDAADVIDVGFRGQRRGQDRADLAAVTGDRDLDRPSYLRPRPPPLRPPRSPPRKPPSRRGGGGDASAVAMASLSMFSSIGSPFAVSSSIAAWRLKLRRPWLSTSVALTTISSPTLATSSTRSTRWSVSLEMCTSPSWLGSTSTKAPKGMMRTTLPL